MQIMFSSDEPRYCGRDLALSFTARVNGAPVQCAITAEALEDHFGAASSRAEDLLRAFGAHRGAIERAAREMLAQVDGHPIVLHSGVFRFMGNDVHSARRADDGQPGG